MQQYPNNEQSSYPYPQPQTSYTQPPVQPPQPPKKRRRWVRWTLIIAAIVLVIGVINAIASGGNGVGNTANTNTPTTQPTQASHPTSAPTPTAQPIRYPPTSKADLLGLAAKGDASAVHEFHSESVGLTGVCPQPKREVTVDSSITGKQLTEDLLAYWYANQLENPCGAVVFAFHAQSDVDAGNGYTAGRLLLDVTDTGGQVNTDPNASGLKYSLTLDTGDVATGQEYVVHY